MPGRAPQIYEYYKDLAQRAEYLLVGIIAASVAFFWKAEAAAKLGLNPATVHLVGLLFLLAAMMVALSRLHRQPGVFAYMAEEHDLGDERAQLVKSASEDKSVVGSYGVLRPSDQVKRIGEIDRAISGIRVATDDLNARCNRLYKIRNWLLVIGYSLMLSERIWIPYYKT
ncbi:MAG: hypothetical protein ABI992_08450 [Chthoniobacterales bacterium]